MPSKQLNWAAVNGWNAVGLFVAGTLVRLGWNLGGWIWLRLAG